MYFGLTEYFTDEVDRALYLVGMTRLVSFDDQYYAHHMGGGRDVKEEEFPVFLCSQDGWRCEEIL